MTQKFALANNTTIGDRLTFVGNDSAQLSTGDLVMLAYDPSQADPNKITLQLVTAHTTPSVIATLPAATLGDFCLQYPRPQTLAMCLDANDNIYVFGNYANRNLLGYQAFIKQPGVLVWAPMPFNAAGGLSPLYQMFGFAATWCNTGGGTNAAGHILVIANTNSNQTGAFILDAGLVQQGKGAITQITTNPSFLGSGGAATAGSNLDLDNDGFGATTGMAISALNIANGYQLGAWGVSSNGHLTAGGGFIAIGGSDTATLSATTKLRIVRVAPNQWSLVYPSIANAGQLTVVGCSATGFLGINAFIDTGTASNFPAPSASLAWDVSTDSQGTTWVYGWSSATPTTMLRVPITFPGGVGTLGTVVSDDTSVGTGTNTTIRVVSDPVDFGHVDWQSYDTVSPYSLLGDYSAFPIAPAVPQLLSPANNAAAALAGGGVLDWSFLSPLFGDAQVSYALQIQVSGGAYQWFNGTTLQGSEIYVTSSATQATLPAALLTATDTYQWTVSVKGASGLASGYASPWTFTVLTPPTAPTLTASFNSATNRNILVATGNASTAVLGSIEYSDDGGVTWQFIRGGTQFVIYPGPVTFHDYEFGTTATRQYRARAWSALPYNPSSYATASVAPPTLTTYNLVDAIGGTVIPVLLKTGSSSSQRNEPLTIHGPIGAQFDLIVADLIKGRSKLRTFVTTNITDRDALDNVIDLQRPLWYQSPIDASRWVRVTAAATTEVPVQGAPWITYYEHAVTFSTVARPAP